LNVSKKQYTVWMLNGDRVPARTPGATKETRETENYYGTVGGRRVPLCPDYKAAIRMLRKLLADGELKRVGLADPHADHKSRPLADHIADYATVLRAKGDTETHISLTVQRVTALTAGCGFRSFADADAGKAAEWLANLRNPASRAEVPVAASFTPAEEATILGISGAAVRAAVSRHRLEASGHGKARRLPRATVLALAEHMAKGRGPETLNHYVRAVRGFFRWLVKAKRAPFNPLDSLELVNAKADVRRARRELTAEELRHLFATTAKSGRRFRGLSGEDRRCLYLTAAATGFRASALAALTPADFDLMRVIRP
jgi:integrase/recombinase XerC